MGLFLRSYHNISVLNQELSFLGSGQIVVNMTIALVCGLLVALFYCLTRERDYSPTFVNSLVALSMITTIVITVIGNNLARAFGLVGALSIIRFRMGVKDMNDIVFIFFSLAVGMAAGVGLLVTALTGTIFIGAVAVLLSRVHTTSPKAQEFVLRFSFTLPDPPIEQGRPYRPVLAHYCRRYELVRAKPIKDGDAVALSFWVDLRDKNQKEDLVRELGHIPGVDSIDLIKGGYEAGRLRKKRKAG
jgi:uncharacterized membrane protein YhiD involved in acid resistance